MIFNNKAKNNLLFKNLPLSAYRLPPKKGFTLIEMLVVIAVIGILYLIVFGSVSDSKKRGRDSKRIADISVIQLSLEKYYDEFKQYPSLLTTLKNYDKSVLTTDSLNNSYIYYASCINNNCQSYHLGANLELNNPILNDDTLDKDDTGGFNGADGSDCTGATLSGYYCYDVLPKF